MGVFNRKGTVRDGLVLELDAANQKSWGGGDTWKDNTSQGNDGTLTNGPVHSQGPFPGAGYVNIDGTSRTQGLTLPSVSTVMGDGTGDWTIEFWYMTPSFTTSGGTTTVIPLINNIYWYNSNDGSFWSHVNSDRKIALSTQHSGGAFGTSVEVTSTSTISTNTWYHMAFVKQGNTLRLYFNGVQEDTDTVTNLSSSGFNSSGNALSIGRWYNYISSAPDTSEFGIGNFSNVRIVNSAVYPDGTSFTPQLSELTSVPNTKLLTCQKGTITDNSISGHSITVTGNAAAVYNDVSYFDFDGTDQNITFTNSLFNSNQNFTFSVWFEGSTNSNSILSSTIAGGLCIKTWSSGSKIMIEEVGSPFGQGGQLAYSTNSLGIDDGQIHNIVVTRTGNVVAQDLKIYHNGEGPVDTTYTNGGGSQTLNSTNVNVIGSEYNTSSSQTNYFDGKIHHVCAFQKALTSTEITKNFNALRARFGI